MRQSKINHSLRKLRHLVSREEKGATAIEMAFIVPFLLYLTLITVEIGIIILISVMLEGAVTTAARNAKTGGAEAGGMITRDQAIQAEILTRTANLLDPSRLKFEIHIYGDTNYKEGDPANPGGAGDLVVMTVEYKWPIFTPFVGTFFGNENKEYIIDSQVTYRNEPF